MATTKPRYTVSVDKELFEKIENFRFENRFQTRADATVELIKLGFTYIEQNEKNINIGEINQNGNNNNINF